jgi:thiamine-monophosphate kinase
MTLKSESELLARIASLCAPATGGDIIQGIGDDCAVFRTSGGHGLITTDISIENVHFKRSLSSPEDFGYKAMSGNLSDIAAMGGAARFAFVSLGLPPDLDQSFIDDLYRGMMRAADPAGARILGGDLSRSSIVVINIAVYGEAHPAGAVLRSGARPGDPIYLTGSTGASLAGLEILTETGDAEAFQSLVLKHRIPENRLAWAREIVETFKPTAMIDISDGLLIDLGRLCQASRTGFMIIGENIPLADALKNFALSRGRDPLHYALNSGEEYELLFTSARPSQKSLDLSGGLCATPIGHILAGGFYLSRKGVQNAVDITGYDHFA